MKNQLEKTTSSFNLISRSLCSCSWAESAKLTIYKTFVRSILEYGAPLIVLLKKHATSRKAKKIFKQGFEQLDNLQTECLRWAVGKKRAKKNLTGHHGNARNRHSIRGTNSTTPCPSSRYVSVPSTPFVEGPYRCLPISTCRIHLPGDRSHYDYKHQQLFPDSFSDHLQDLFTTGSTHR
jgi:hypothetical protein